MIIGVDKIKIRHITMYVHSYCAGDLRMGQLRLLADLDEKLVKDFKKALIDDETNYKEWLIRQIQQYLKKKGG